MSVYRLRSLCVEVYKAINNLNPEFMSNTFKVEENKRLVNKRLVNKRLVNKRLVRKQEKLNIKTPEWKQITFGAKMNQKVNYLLVLFFYHVFYKILHRLNT